MTRRVNRELVILLKGFGLSLKEVAARVGCSESWVVVIWRRRGEVIG